MNPSFFAPRNRPIVLAIVASLLLSIVAAFVLQRASLHGSLFDLSNLVGPTARSLTESHSLDVNTDDMGTPGRPILFHSARMPLASVVVAFGASVFGEHGFLGADLLKIVVFLVPIWASMLLVWRKTREAPRAKAVLGLLLAPFLMTTFLANVVNLQVEEGYAYSLLAFAFAVVLFRPPQCGKDDLPWAVAFGVGLALLFFAKSSMILVVAVMAVARIVQERGVAARAAIALLVVGGLFGWGVCQRAASGHFALGTSLDGINLHKGNNDRFLERYPPPAGDSLDRYDSELNTGLQFHDEWDYDAYHKKEATTYIRAHPAETLRGAFRKAVVFFLSVRKYGSTESSGVQKLLEGAGLVVFRLALWTSIAVSTWAVFRRRSPGRFEGALFLLVVMSVAAPYLIGFAYTRHAAVLIYPVALLLCRALLPERFESP